MTYGGDEDQAEVDTGHGVQTWFSSYLFSWGNNNHLFKGSNLETSNRPSYYAMFSCLCGSVGKIR